MLLRKITLVVDCLVGIIVLLAASTDIAMGLYSNTWPTTLGKVSHAEVVQKKLSIIVGSHDEPAVAYSFIVKDKKFESDRIKFGGPSWNNAEQAVGKFQAEPITVHYNPDNPHLCVLETGFNAQTAWLEGLIVLIFALLAFGDVRSLKTLEDAAKKRLSG